MQLNDEMLDTVKKLFGLDTIVFLDFETFYKTHARDGSKSYSLSRKTYAWYHFNERFHTTGFGFAEDSGDVEYIQEADEIAMYMEELTCRRATGEKIGVCAHNTRFDATICNWLFHTKFDAYFCTKDMAKLLEPHLPASLKACAIRAWPEDEELRKGGQELMDVDGISFDYITERQHENLEKYCRQDVELDRKLFVEQVMRIIGGGLYDELRLIHITLRGFIEPQFAINREMLWDLVTEDTAKKDTALEAAVEFCESMYVACPVDAKTFSSDKKYETLLRELNVVIPYKISPKTGKKTTAFGKADPEYLDAQAANPALAPVFNARNALNSNTDATRAATMEQVADEFHERGFTDADMPFFLNYYGAGQTGRWSGGEKLNQQNLGSGRGDSTNKHRLSMMAPDGYLIDVCDLSNIELRVNMWLCGQNDVLEQMSDIDYDYYCDLASTIFGFNVIKDEHKAERQMGKAAGLGLGFAMGWPGFQRYLATGPMGIPPMKKSDGFCQNVKNQYNVKHSKVMAMWKFLAQYVIPILVNGGTIAFGPNNCITASKDQVKLPSGRILRYANARFESTEYSGGFDSKVVFDSDVRNSKTGIPLKKYLWHGMLIENLAQAIARDILGWQMVKVEKMLQEKELGWVSGSVHDEILSMVKEDRGVEAHTAVDAIMRTAPEWASTLPLDCEGGFDKNYSK
jgi:DNA polymerase